MASAWSTTLQIKPWVTQSPQKVQPEIGIIIQVVFPFALHPKLLNAPKEIRMHLLVLFFVMFCVEFQHLVIKPHITQQKAPKDGAYSLCCKFLRVGFFEVPIDQICDSSQTEMKIKAYRTILCHKRMHNITKCYHRQCSNTNIHCLISVSCSFHFHQNWFVAVILQCFQTLFCTFLRSSFGRVSLQQFQSDSCAYRCWGEIGVVVELPVAFFVRVKDTYMK